MCEDVSVTIKGIPERVQRIADAIDRSLPGHFCWNEAENLYPLGTILLKGRSGPQAETPLASA